MAKSLGLHITSPLKSSEIEKLISLPHLGHTKVPPIQSVLSCAVSA